MILFGNIPAWLGTLTTSWTEKLWSIETRLALSLKSRTMPPSRGWGRETPRCKCRARYIHETQCRWRATTRIEASSAKKSRHGFYSCIEILDVKRKGGQEEIHTRSNEEKLHTRNRRVFSLFIAQGVALDFSLSGSDNLSWFLWFLWIFFFCHIATICSYSVVLL